MRNIAESLLFRPPIEVQLAHNNRTEIPCIVLQTTIKSSEDEATVPVEESDAERDQAVKQIVRDLIKGVIITERDTLRRNVRKKRDRLSKVFTIEPTTSTE